MSFQKGWAFRVGTWNIDSLTGRSGELVEALAERRMDVACVRWRGSGCKLFGAIEMEEDDKGCPMIRLGVSG